MAKRDISKPAIVYKITHRESGKAYIGATSKTLRRRWREHLSQARSITRAKWTLHKAISEYGPEAFDVVELERMESYVAAATRERELIVELDTMRRGYNETNGGELLGGVEFSPEMHDRISAALKKRMSRPEACANLSITQKGRVFSPGHRAKLSAAHKREVWKRRCCFQGWLRISIRPYALPIGVVA